MSRRSVDVDNGLTPQMEAFCVSLARTGNQSEAYREAYPKSKMNPNSLAVAASRLAALPKIQLRLSQLRSDVRKASGITLTEHMRDLRSLRDAARAAKQFGPAVTAEMARGKVSGLYEGQEEGGDPPTPVSVTVNVVDGRK